MMHSQGPREVLLEGGSCKHERVPALKLVGKKVGMYVVTVSGSSSGLSVLGKAIGLVHSIGIFIST